MTTPGTDVIQLLEADHRQVQQLLGRFDGISPAERESYFCEVVQELVKHEVAEEIVVYPALRQHASGGAAEADARIKEQSEAEEMLAKMDASSPAFAADFVKLRGAVLEHAQAEEGGAFVLLRQAEDVDARAKLGKRYEMAKATAPTHPHPHAPDTPPGNMVLGPVAAVLDRTRDAIKKI
jgi:hemerythrin superfamily protein